MSDMTYLALAPNCWGRGKTVEAAIKECRKHCNLRDKDQRDRKSFSIYQTSDPEVYCDDMWVTSSPRKGRS